ncbi:patatin-like phospholipase family protein [Roseococcus sp. YIM B11640]|uniref:patatin-like phospholipase family protein n=1 Tax=Roseococcus sp. YIM B11640 TaxID=3133973 RepID=UPI003C7E4414
MPPRRKPPTEKPSLEAFDSIALLLQGGGALGAYQGGVCEALAECGIEPGWIAGISIGAINAAIIAGNPPEMRCVRLRRFWEQVSEGQASRWAHWWLDGARLGSGAHSVLNRLGAMEALVAGAPGFFTPRISGFGFPPLGVTSWYDTSPLEATLEELVDFDRLNNGGMRVSLGAVNVRTGNFAYFDTTTHRIGPRHIIASGALPPGFPPVEIDGELYWDGGLVSNTPLEWVFRQSKARGMLAFQVDLWSARGEAPRDLTEVAVRQKEIQFSSRTRAGTDHLKRVQAFRTAVLRLLEHAPAELKASDDGKLLAEFADRKVANIVQLIYRTRPHEVDSKDYNFSRLAMEEHWRVGRQDARRALRHPEIFEPPQGEDSVQTFDFRPEPGEPG